ncbi:hypothetical protein DAEQUDRAFT_737333 [Daedalea quercina L-15889]|uniref:Uncharacterized protein n=1 Tax=Daedalea quercina L-15889 TaxID=1314783 RepID=A0A165RFR3_9APHY|nr:hypothetical protein DAEQUDRAFT_737333 [Daedalea quercina L-15889]
MKDSNSGWAGDKQGKQVIDKASGQAINKASRQVINKDSSNKQGKQAIDKASRRAINKEGKRAIKISRQAINKASAQAMNKAGARAMSKAGAQDGRKPKGAQWGTICATGERNPLARHLSPTAPHSCPAPALFLSPPASLAPPNGLPDNPNTAHRPVVKCRARDLACGMCNRVRIMALRTSEDRASRACDRLQRHAKYVAGARGGMIRPGGREAAANRAPGSESEDQPHVHGPCQQHPIGRKPTTAHAPRAGTMGTWPTAVWPPTTSATSTGPLTPRVTTTAH